jgi:rhodanese-related sulfurtransferase
MASADAVRRRLETQGCVGVGDRALAEIQAGLRFTPALCAAGVAVGTVLASPIILAAIMVTAAIGAASPRHPFDVLYNHAVRRLVNKPAVPRNAPPRRFSCGVAAVWLAGTAAAFPGGWNPIGYVLGAGLAGMAAFVAVTHICLPSLVYTRLFERVGDAPEVSVEDAWRRVQDGAVAVDVRDPAFWHAGHAPGALNIAASELSSDGLPFHRDQAVLVVCQSGVSSLKGAKTLRRAGFAATCSVRGGMAAWLKRGLPLEAGSEA